MCFGDPALTPHDLETLFDLARDSREIITGHGGLDLTVTTFLEATCRATNEQREQREVAACEQ